MKPLFTVALFLLSQFCAAQTRDSPPFPNEDEIKLLLTQSDRAFTQYELALKQEEQAGPDEAASVKNDHELLNRAREVLNGLQKHPHGFNSPVGFLLVGNLDDAGRNMALCTVQIVTKATTDAEAGDFVTAHRLLHTAQTCTDTNTLLYTVSETAFDMYARFLVAQDAMTKDAASTVQQCMDIIKNGCKKKP
ncbi:MAG TPA: hypothetical protein VK763_20660 [Terriglobales bacterium]|jgi:hypothetical protein|nr:hypothetical protein [Terriglobales bacterium]